MILNTVEHPFSTASILNWMLEQWSIQPSRPLVLILPPGEGEKVDNRIRVKVAKIRKSLLSSGQDDFIQFGFHSMVIPWTEATGTNLDALCINRVKTGRHKALEVLSRSSMKDLLKWP